MIAHFQQAYHLALAVLSIIGLGTVVKAIPKGIQWLYKRYEKSVEDRILSTFYGNEDGPWQSAHGVLGDLGLKAALSDALGYLMPRGLTGWKAWAYWLKMLPYRLRHTYRRMFVIPSKERADKVLKRLWERGLLVRAGWTHTKNEFYRLKD
jgi:hypothetical protein